MKEKDRLNAVGNLIQQKRNEKKAKRRAKIRAKVKLKVQKEVEKIKAGLSSALEKIELVKQDINLFNPKMIPLQPHTKTKWVEGLEDSLNELRNISFDKKG